ncbi:MAG: 1-acyl-sn-glycerol-3-phosphate acyltransferase [Chitinophagaceae bacterium]|nr:1-acyl-sn-glycerol-3-phosphate acyltransferase [Chitinophagaceae bacterium]
MNQITRFFQIIFTVYAFFIFVGFMLLIFPVAVLASFFGKIKGGNVVYWLCHLWADFFLFMIGISHRNLYEVPHDRTKQYVFIFNHISYMDIPVILKTIRRQHVRVLGKAEMAKVPLFGFLYKTAAVMVDRGDPEKRARSVEQLIAVLKKGISIVIAPEGTFNMTHKPLKDFYDGAFKVAIETQTPIKPLLFLDTYDRMGYESIFSIKPGRSRSVYLDEVSVEGLSLEDVDQLKEKVYQIMETKLIEYKGSWIRSMS